MCEYPYILEQKSQNTTLLDESQQQNQSVFGTKPNTSLMDPFGSLSTAPGGSRLPKINDSTLEANSSNYNTSYGAWNKLTKGDLIVR